MAKYHAVTGEERCQRFGPVETKKGRPGERGNAYQSG